MELYTELISTANLQDRLSALALDGWMPVSDHAEVTLEGVASESLMLTERRVTDYRFVFARSTGKLEKETRDAIEEKATIENTAMVKAAEQMLKNMLRDTGLVREGPKPFEKAP